MYVCMYVCTPLGSRWRQQHRIPLTPPPPLIQHQWVAFLASGSTAGYVFLYSIYYFLCKTKMSGLLQTSFYFGYTCVFFAFFFCSILNKTQQAWVSNQSKSLPASTAASTYLSFIFIHPFIHSFTHAQQARITL